MRVLITGARGQLGSDFHELLPDAVALGREELAVQDESAVAAAFREAAPELVLNCAAYNAVDSAEQESELSMAVNGEAPGVLARACARTGAHLVHFSTNYVFDGRSERPYTEDDLPNPRSAYARSKHLGEVRALEALPSALVVRAGALFGRRGSAIKGGSFPERIVARAQAGEPLRVVDDQYVNPTYTLDLAEAVLRLVQAGMSGIVHVAPFDCCSWREFALEALRVAGLSSVEVEAARSGDFPGAAERPRQGCLTSARVAPLRSWREGLKAYWVASQTKSAADAHPM